MTSKRAVVVALALAAGLGLSGCGKLFGRSAPTGQVVARVGDEEITALDLQTELAGYKAPDAKARKAAEQAALQRIIERKILAQAARDEKVAKSPEFARQRERLEEVLLVRTWQGQLARSVPPPNADDAQVYMTQHPEVFGARKKFEIDTVKFVAPPDKSLSDAMHPMSTLDEVKVLLTSRNIPFETGSGEVDAFNTDPNLVQLLLKVPPTDLFATNQGNIWTVGKIREIKTEPVPANLAVSRAMDLIRAQRITEAVSRRLSLAYTQGKKTVVYNKLYQPPPAPKTAPPAAPAAPALPPPPAAETAPTPKVS